MKLNEHKHIIELINLFNLLRDVDITLKNTIFVVIDAEYVFENIESKIIGRKEYTIPILDGFLGALFIKDNDAYYRIYGYKTNKSLDNEFLKKPSQIKYVDEFIEDLNKLLLQNPDKNIIVISYYLPAELNFLKYSLLYFAIKDKDFEEDRYTPEQFLDNNRNKVITASGSFYFKLKDRIHIIDLMTLTNYRDGLEEFAEDMFKTSSKKLGRGDLVSEMDISDVINYNFADCYMTAMLFVNFILNMISLYKRFNIRFNLFNESGSCKFTMGSIVQDIMLQLYEQDKKSNFFSVLQDIQEHDIEKNNESLSGVYKYSKDEEKLLKRLNKYYNYGGNSLFLKKKLLEIKRVLKVFEERYSGGGFIDNINDKPILFKGSLIDFTSLYPYSMLDLLHDIGIKMSVINGNFSKKDISKIYEKNKNAFIAVDYVRFKKDVTFPFPSRIKYKVNEENEDFTTMSVVALENEASIQSVKLLYEYLDEIEDIRFSEYYTFDDDFTDSKVYNFILSVLQERLNTKDSAMKLIYKSVLNVLYGKFAQQKPKPSRIYLPLISSGITAKSREIMIRGIKFLERNGYDVIATATDSIIFKSKDNEDSKDIINKLNEHMIELYKHIQLTNFTPFKVEYLDCPILYIRLKFYIVFNKNFNLPQNSDECLQLLKGLLDGSVKLRYKDVVEKFKTLGMSIYKDESYRLKIALLYLLYHYLIEEGKFNDLNEIKMKNFDWLESLIGIKIFTKDHQLKLQEYVDLMLKRYMFFNSIDERVMKVVTKKLNDLGYDSINKKPLNEIKEIAKRHNIDIDKIKKGLMERAELDSEFTKKVRNLINSISFLKLMGVRDADEDDGEIEINNLLIYYYLLDYNLVLSEEHIKFHIKQHGLQYPMKISEKLELQEKGSRIAGTLKKKILRIEQSFDDILKQVTITYKGFPVNVMLLDAPFTTRKFKSWNISKVVDGDEVTDYQKVFDVIWGNGNGSK